MSEINKDFPEASQKLTLSELRKKVKTKGNKYKIAAKELNECPSIFFDLLKEILESGEKVQLKGFGNFRPAQRKRTTIHGIDGNKILTDPLKNVLFSQSKELEKKINAVNPSKKNKREEYV